MGNQAAKSEKSYLLESYDEHSEGINCMEVSEDNTILVTGSDDKHIKVWDIKSEPVKCLGTLEGHEDYVTDLRIEENFVLSASADGTIRKWDLTTFECVLLFHGHVSTVNKILCTGDFIFSVAYDSHARMWDFDTGECVRLFKGHKHTITSVLFVPTERENLIEAVDFIKSHAEKKKMQIKIDMIQQVRGLNNQTADQEEDENEIYARDIIITGSLDHSARSWSVETGECIHIFRGHNAGITCMATDPLGKLLFTGSTDHDIRSWEIMTGQLLKVFTGHQTTVLSLLAHKKLLFSTSSDHTARCWVMEFGDCTRVFKDHNHSVSTLIENDGLLFTGCGDGIARCFDAKSGTLKRAFKGHTGAVNCLRLVGKRLFTGSCDGTLKVFDSSGLVQDKDDDKNNLKLEDYDLEANRQVDSRNDIDLDIDERDY